MKTKNSIIFLIVCLLCSERMNAQYTRLEQMRMERKAHENYKARKANGENVSVYEGTEAGVSLPLWSLQFEHTYDVYNTYNYSNYEERKVIGTETITRKVPAKGYIFTVSPSWVLAKMSRECNLSLKMNITMGSVAYDIGEVVMPYKRYDQPIRGVLLGTPITLDIKYGGEATFDKSDALSLSAGVGLAPMGYMSGFLNAASFHGTLSPCAHIGFGFFLGAEWKLQASVIGGSMTVLNLKESDVPQGFDNNTVIKAKTTAPLMSVGIICFPFSYGWDKGGW